MTQASAFVVITAMIGLIYATVLQTYRTEVNAPPIQTHDAIAEGSERDAVPSTSDSIDLTNRLIPFVMFLDTEGCPLQSPDGSNEERPQVQKSVLEYVNKNGENRVTGKLQPNMIMTVIVEKTSSPTTYFVAAGRPLEEVENLEANLIKKIFRAWVVCMVILGINWVLTLKPSST